MAVWERLQVKRIDGCTNLTVNDKKLTFPNKCMNFLWETMDYFSKSSEIVPVVTWTIDHRYGLLSIGFICSLTK